MSHISATAFYRGRLSAAFMGAIGACVVGSAVGAQHVLPPDATKLRPYDGPVIADETPSIVVSAEAVDYAFASASFGAAVAYCNARYGEMHQSNRAGECFERAKSLIAARDMSSDIGAAKDACRLKDLRTCLTPLVGQMLERLIASFRSNGL